MEQVCTYLNFPRNTTEVFNYYKSIFEGEFSGGGTARLGDIPPSEAGPRIEDRFSKAESSMLIASQTKDN